MNMMFTPHALQRRSLVAVTAAAALAGTVLIGGVAPAEARVIRIVIDQTLNNLPPTGVQTKPTATPGICTSRGTRTISR